MDILSLGLEYVPGPDRAPHTLTPDIEAFCRRLQLSNHFASHPPSEPTPFTAPSTWHPPQANPHIESLQRELHHQLPQAWKKAPPHRLKHEVQPALRELTNHPNLVIKSADKGACIVLMDLARYSQEALAQLHTAKHYTPIGAPVFPRVMDTINGLIGQLHTLEFITKKQMEFIRLDPNSRDRLFYLLPKIHKPTSKWPQPGRMAPGRPIVSDTGSESYQLSKFLAYTIHPLATTHPSYVKDTPDFIDKITNSPIPPHAILATLDVSSLYTNIEAKMGLEAVKKALANSEAFSPKVSAILLQLLHLLLQNNDFKFGISWFLQILGTAMGKPFAPEYANLAMWAWEVLALAACSMAPHLYLRYLDDIFIIWEHSTEDLLIFQNTLNSISPHIQLTLEHSLTSINFLDATVFKGARFMKSGVLDTKAFFKPTDTHTLLHRDSFHPPHTFKGIALSQAIRFNRLCTHPMHARAAYHTLSRALKARGYGTMDLRKAAHKAWARDPRFPPVPPTPHFQGHSTLTGHQAVHPPHARQSSLSYPL